MVSIYEWLVQCTGFPGNDLPIFYCSFLLYSISHPNKNGSPSIDLAKDKDADPIYSEDVQYKSQSQVLVDRVLTKVVAEPLTSK